MPDSRLRKLELSGFKTFARRTEVILPGGLTGIVGPNGSGKSNLADAVRWVLGEQSLQHIRSKKTEDVIFAGGANRPPMGAAEVTLTLDNTSGWIPLDFSEVTISRRAYRSGDNEYFINGSRVRLRDIIELRTRAGFGQSSYSVIGQGLVDAVLSQRPEERRALFEEAAGIRHYQAKRDQTLDQLVATRQNLVRVQDIVAEIEPRLESLRRQSERARQHGQLSEELRVLQIRWYAGRHRQLRRQLAEAESMAAEAQRELERAAEEARSLETRIGALDTERQDVDQRLAGETQHLAELARRQEQLRGQAELAADKLQFLEQQGQDLTRELAELEQARTGLSERRQAMAAGLDKIHQTEAELVRQLQEAERSAADGSAGLRALERALEQARERLSGAIAAQNQRRAEAQQLKERCRELDAQREQHHQDGRRKQGLLGALRDKQASLQGELQRLRGEEERLSGQTETARLDAQAAAAALQEKSADVAELRRRHDEASTRLALLEELQTNMEGLAQATRELLASGRPGVLGSVAEGLKVRPGYERAIAALLAHKLDAVLVEGEAVALDVLGEVSEATLALASPGTFADPRQEREGTAAQSFVDAAHPILHRLLAGAAIADDLTQAMSLARNGWRAATRDGDVVEPDGTITRRHTSAAEAVLKRQRNLEELSAEVQARSNELAAAEKEQSRLAQAHAAEEARLKELEGAGRRVAAARQQRTNEMRDLAQQLQAVQAQIEWLASLEQQVAQQFEALELRQTALVAESDQARASLSELEAEAARQQAELAACREAEQAGAQRLEELRITLEVTRQEKQHAQSQLGQIDQQLAAAEHQLAARQGRASEHASTVTQLQAQIDAARIELAQIGSDMQEQEALLTPLRDRLNACSDELRSLRQREGEAHERQAELDKRCYRLQFDSQRKRDDLEALAASLLEDLQLTPDVLPEPDPELPEPAKREVEALKMRLAALGPINPGALEEFEEVRQRHEFLTTQQADLEQAAQQLQGVIVELEELTNRQFLETFEQVAREFERYFQLMFNGGQVQMFLSDPGDVQRTGVEILAQPPGKRLQALALLSGGERALVASALLFAILSAKPVPFCLLDEVDAALDEANVKRFCQALKSLAEQTQFVVITHNRETMAVADALYGVSMSQDGVSRLVSLRLPREEEWSQAQAAAAAVSS